MIGTMGKIWNPAHALIMRGVSASDGKITWLYQYGCLFKCCFDRSKYWQQHRIQASRSWLRST